MIDGAWYRYRIKLLKVRARALSLQVFFTFRSINKHYTNIII